MARSQRPLPSLEVHTFPTPHLVHAALPADPLVRRINKAERLVEVVHGAVKRVHVLVAQRLGIADVPAATALFQRAAVACGAQWGGGTVCGKGVGEVGNLAGAAGCVEGALVWVRETVHTCTKETVHTCTK
eukprot:359808-Chlamydomonas_euryale.AAC.2